MTTDVIKLGVGRFRIDFINRGKLIKRIEQTLRTTFRAFQDYLRKMF